MTELMERVKNRLDYYKKYPRSLNDGISPATAEEFLTDMQALYDELASFKKEVSEDTLWRARSRDYSNQKFNTWAIVNLEDLSVWQKGVLEEPELTQLQFMKNNKWENY